MNFALYNKIRELAKTMHLALENIIVLMSQFNDLYRLKKCMHTWFNTDTALLVQTKFDINDAYKQRAISDHFNEMKNKFWSEFTEKENIDILKDKYPYFIPDEVIYDPSKRYYTTIKYEFYSWLKINKSDEISSLFTEKDREFLGKINNFKITHKKLVITELNKIKITISEHFSLIKPHLPADHRIIKNVERILDMYA